MKTSTLSADNFKKISDLDGSKPEPAIRSSDTGQQDTLFWQLSIDHNIDVQYVYQFSCAPKLAKKYDWTLFAI